MQLIVNVVCCSEVEVGMKTKNRSLSLAVSATGAAFLY